MIKVPLLGLFASLALLTPAVAASDVPEPTEVIVVAPPADWVTSVWRGGTVELAEFTPKGQTGGAYVDLLGYSVMPLVAEAPKTAEGVPAYETKTLRKGCDRPAIRQRPRAEGWTDLQAICFNRPGASAGTIEISLVSVKVTEQGYYRVWRNWRGSSADLDTMLKARTGGEAPALLDVNGRENEAGVDQLLSMLQPLYWPEIEGAVICDLSHPKVCPALAGPLPNVSRRYVKQPYIAAFYASGLNRIDSRQFMEMMGATGPGDGTPDRVIFEVAAADALRIGANDWQKVILAVATGQAADGGLLTISGKTLPLEDVIVIRRRVVMMARQVWQKDFPPASVSISLTSMPE